jgi:hypothetical protein
VVSDPMTDEDWKMLILRIKGDFARMGELKAKTIRSFEKFVLFENKYVSLEKLCADLHANIIDTPSAKLARLRAKFDHSL